MSGICGWIGVPTGSDDARATIERMTSALGRFDGTAGATRLTNNAAIGACGFLGMSATVSDDDLLVALSAGFNLRFRNDIGEISDPTAIAVALARSYRSSGVEALAKLSGAFSVAIVDLPRRRALLAIDRTGVHNLIYVPVGDGLIFASATRCLNEHPKIVNRLRNQGIYDYLYFHMIPGPDTIFEGQRRLQPGEFVELRNGTVNAGRYWWPVFEESVRRPVEDLRGRFKTVVQEAVANQVSGSKSGCFLSGGTDSSTITGMLGAATSSAPNTFSIGFAAEGYDEMEFARIAARHFGAQHNEYYVTPDDIVEAIPKVAEISDQPFGNSSIVPTYFCAKLARSHGIERLLGGDGGDELFGGNARYARQRVFERYFHIPSILRKLIIEPAILGLPPDPPTKLLRKARSYVGQASIPLPGRLETYNLLLHFGPSEIFAPDFLRAVDQNHPAQLMQETYASVHAGTMINRLLGLDFKFTLADNDLVKVNLACELAGIPVGYPMLDDRLMAFSLALDPELKLKGTELRYFFKEALRGFLPDEIINKKKHGFGLPFGPWLATHDRLQELARESMKSLRGRAIIQPKFLDRVMAPIDMHPGYYGTMVWVLVMLEQWLAKHNTSF